MSIPRGVGKNRPMIFMHRGKLMHGSPVQVVDVNPGFLSIGCTDISHEAMKHIAKEHLKEEPQTAKAKPVHSSTAKPKFCQRERLTTERMELREKIETLRSLIHGPVWKSLPAEDRIQIRRQIECMVKYHDILEERIEAGKGG